MSDIALDRELQALLGAAPSPEFVARVRTRIAAEPRRFRLGSGSRTFAAAALAVAAVLIVAVRIGRPGHVDRTALTLNARRLPIREFATPAPRFRGEIDAPMATSASVSIARRRNPPKATNQGPSTSAATPTAAAEPEVLVDRREAAALRAFFARARRGQVALTAIVAPAETPPADNSGLHDIAIAPIAFEPVMRAPEDKGARQ